MGIIVKYFQKWTIPEVKVHVSYSELNLACLLVSWGCRKKIS